MCKSKSTQLFWLQINVNLKKPNTDDLLQFLNCLLLLYMRMYVLFFMNSIMILL